MLVGLSVLLRLLIFTFIFLLHFSHLSILLSHTLSLIHLSTFSLLPSPPSALFPLSSPIMFPPPPHIDLPFLRLTPFLCLAPFFLSSPATLSPLFSCLTTSYSPSSHPSSCRYPFTSLDTPTFTSSSSSSARRDVGSAQGTVLPGVTGIQNDTLECDSSRAPENKRRWKRRGRKGRLRTSISTSPL